MFSKNSVSSQIYSNQPYICKLLLLSALSGERSRKAYSDQSLMDLNLPLV